MQEKGKQTTKSDKEETDLNPTDFRVYKRYFV